MSSNSSPKKPSNDYLRYSGMAFQFLAAILLGFFLGKWLDKKFDTYPILTIALAFFFVTSSLVLMIRDFLGRK